MGQSNSNSQIEKNESKDGTTFFSILITTFSTIFLAELGDKTQLATLMLSAQSGRPLIIFIGAALALISTSLLGVLIGRWIANNLPRQRFTVLSGIIMLSLGLYLVTQGFVDLYKSRIWTDLMLITLLFTTFVTVFLAEMGDKTQLTTITLSSTTNKPLAVFIGSSVALILATLLGALAGGSIANLIPAFLLKLLSGIVFLIIGINLLAKSKNDSASDS